MNIETKWKDENYLDELRFHDFSYILFKTNELYYKEYILKSGHRASSTSISNLNLADLNHDKYSKYTKTKSLKSKVSTHDSNKSTVCIML